MRMTDNKQNKWAEYMVCYTVTNAKKKNKAKKKNVLSDIRGGDCNFIWGGHRRFNHLSYRLKKRKDPAMLTSRGRALHAEEKLKHVGWGRGLVGGWVDDTGEVTQGSEPRALEAIARTWAFSQWPGYWGVFIQGKTFMLTSSFSGYVVKEGEVGSKRD